METQSTVRTAAGSLAVFERGGPDDGDTVVLVHGWPDCHLVWNPVADRLHDAGFHVVTFDVRGVGGSSRPTGPRPYALEHMAADIGAVIDATAGGRPVHLVGHDWGGVEGWEYVTTDGNADTVATYTTLSGPNIDHLAHLLRTSLRAAIVQGSKSWYTLVLSLPVVRTVLWRLGLERAFRRWLRLSEGIDPASGHPPPCLVADAVAAVPLYRTNVFGRVWRPSVRPCPVPVHQLVATRDRYVSASVLAGAAAFVDDFTRTEVRAGHWMPITHPDDVATAVAGFIRDRSPDATVAGPGAGADGS